MFLGVDVMMGALVGDFVLLDCIGESPFSFPDGLLVLESLQELSLVFFKFQQSDWFVQIPNVG